MTKKIVGDAACELCHASGETIVHALAASPHAQEVWQLTSLYDTLLHAPGNELWDVLL